MDDSLLDAMSHFGFKGPLRHSMVTNDSWYNMAQQIIDYLKSLSECVATNNQRPKFYNVIKDDLRTGKGKKK